MAGAVGLSNGGGLRLAISLFVIFVLVCFMGIQDLRAHRDRESKNAELDAMFRDLQDARRSHDELQKKASDLNDEKLQLAAVKSNTSTMLIQSERKQQLLGEEKTRLEAALGDKDIQIATLKEQLKELDESEKEVVKLRNHLKALEDQLELFKANTTTGSRQESREEPREEAQKQQGEDLDHGLVAADKAEVGVTEGDADLEATKSEEVDDRKREQLDGEGDKVDEDLDAAKTIQDA
ncbi:hypothetical protein SELMODRAFT_409535 [Selaginella moellendorffii]|uniref:Uncharacterized protein n=1 Tax=Selaginella moellendorffii TaxID=88036 RepID=D8RBS0_SELML|nr:uncharacterized protein LOC9631472 [Selaginella moellendorffii]EFJ30551.1 hypothetical protein SELMODRAFT_409535 [Selaginella moellendorffii]|eukprot:XP_002968297.1 uncharacterized protein LOC9631472 [Selaginella moellendorffii]